MTFELRVIEGCPNSGPALEIFHRALAEEGLPDEHVVVRTLASDREAAALGFHGSPSFIASGKDLFPANSQPALSCRVYRTPRGLAGLPELESVRAALRDSAQVPR